MPTSYQIDTELGRVTSTLDGFLSNSDVLGLLQAYRSDPDFDPSFDELSDARGIIDQDVSASTVRRIAYADPFGHGSRRAFIVTDPAAFGLGRMYQMLADAHPNEFRVFRDFEEASAWLKEPRG